jgi:hypothetical protein
MGVKKQPEITGEMDKNMTEQDYQLLSQYLDQELSESQTHALTQRLAAEPQLRDTLKRLQQVDSTLKSTFSGPEVEAVPPAIEAMVAGTQPRIIPLPHKRTANWGFAVAASLLVATSALLVTQWQQSPAPDSTPLAVNALPRALEQSRSSGNEWEVLPDGSQFRAVLSFRSNAGQWCREYWLAGSQGNQHGVACRNGGSWVTKVQVTAQLGGGSGEYRPAGAGDSDQVAEFMASYAADIAVSMAEEAELIARQWQ